MKSLLEKIYGKFLHSLMTGVNPIKKKFIKTYCTVHKYINISAIEILKNNGYISQYEYYKKNISSINEGAMWADQDFKSSNHFYNLDKNRGLYGFSDALSECKKYYNSASSFYKCGDINKSMFYLGSACHLLQDSTVPQHVSNKLLDSHRNFELWILSKILNDYKFEPSGKPIIFTSIDEYIKSNAVASKATYEKYSVILRKNVRYGKIAAIIINRAQKETAGLFLNFYSENIET